MSGLVLLWEGLALSSPPVPSAVPSLNHHTPGCVVLITPVEQTRKQKVRVTQRGLIYRESMRRGGPD